MKQIRFSFFFKIFILVLSLNTTFANVEEIKTSYNLADLKSLTETKDYSEFFQHIYDIRPSQRDKEWQQLVYKNANDFLKKLITDKSINTDFLETLLDLNKYDFISSDEIIGLYTADYAKIILDQCHSQANTKKAECIFQIYRYWQKNKNEDLGLKLEKIITKLSSTSESKELRPYLDKMPTWNIINAIAEGQNADLYCAKTDFQDKLLTKLYTDFSENSDIQLNFNYFSRKCLNALNPKLNKLLSSNKELDRKLALKVFESTQTITEKQKNTFYLFYLLDSPEKSNTFNNAWSAMLGLSKDAESREKLLKDIKNFELLPDEILLNSDKKLVSSVLKLIENSFPEYLDLYYSECKNYYQGSKEFPKGSKTINCLKFLEFAKSEGILTQAQINIIKKALPKNINF